MCAQGICYCSCPGRVASADVTPPVIVIERDRKPKPALVAPALVVEVGSEEESVAVPGLVMVVVVGNIFAAVAVAAED
jgi:hypothetical protein